MWSRCDHDGLGFCICINIRYHFSCLVLAFFRITDFIFQVNLKSETLLMDIYLSIFWLALYPRPEWDVIIMICQSTNNCPSNIWEHLTPLQHSNTATLANLVLWSVGTWQPRPYILWRTQQGRRQDVSHIVKMILHTHFKYMDKTRNKSKVNGF